MTKARFLGILCANEIGTFQGKVVHKLTRHIVWIYGTIVVVLPFNMESDLASVPRVPIIFLLWGDRAHLEAVLHDFLYRDDSFIYVFRTEEEAEEFAQFVYAAQTSIPDVPNAVKIQTNREESDGFFKAAMIGKNQPFRVYHWMWLGVRLGAESSFHRMKVMDNFQVE